MLDATAPAVIAPAFDVADERITVGCGGGGVLEVLELEIDDAIVDAGTFAHWRAAHAAALPGRIGAQDPAAMPDQND